MAKDSLVSLGGNLSNPRDSKPSDYPAVGPSGAAGEKSGQDQLVKLTLNQEGPRHVADSGENTPSVWGNTGQFAPQKNKGEGAGQTDVKCDWGVDFKTGQITPSLETSY